MHSFRFNKSKKRRSTIKRKRGGKALAAGTYGCVFYPAIKCKTRKQRSSGISKLMTTKYANREMVEISKVKKVITQIPNQEKYFLLHDTFACLPDQLSDEDKTNFDATCQNLTRYGISEHNVNDEKWLKQLKMINVPYGGISLFDVVQNMEMKSSVQKRQDFIKINALLTELLLNAIVPMNKLGLLHNDIKNDNILITMDTPSQARLIDWGKATKFSTNKRTKVPENLKNYSFTFNCPFSSILFTSEKPALMRQNSVNSINSMNWQQIALKLYEETDSNDSNHLKYIAENIELVANSLNYKSVIIDYITSVLSVYHDKDNHFKADQYFKEVYSKNADIYGFLMCYVDFLNIIDTSAYKSALKELLIKYCYSELYATRAIPIDSLVKDLRKLSALA